MRNTPRIPSSRARGTSRALRDSPQRPGPARSCWCLGPGVSSLPYRPIRPTWRPSWWCRWPTIHRKSIKNQWKSMKIHGKPLKINENPWETNENSLAFRKTNENPGNSIENQWTSIEHRHVFLFSSRQADQHSGFSSLDSAVAQSRLGAETKTSRKRVYLGLNMLKSYDVYLDSYYIRLNHIYIYMIYDDLCDYIDSI